MMIEALVQYIQEQGFEVSVSPGGLLIRKGDYGVDWTISKTELGSIMPFLLFNEADNILRQLKMAMQA